MIEMSQKTEEKAIEKSMTDAEIIKAVECCCDMDIRKCIKECPLKDFDGECYTAMKRDILDLINRKNAEIRETRRDLLNEIISLEHQLETARAEAIKEVYTRLAMNFGTYTDNDSVKLVDLFRLFDQIEKEMGVEL